MVEVRFSSLVFHENGVVVDVASELEYFWLWLGPEAGYLQFTKVKGSDSYISRSVVPPGSPEPSPRVSARGVLWSRRAALEADAAIAGFIAKGGSK